MIGGVLDQRLDFNELELGQVFADSCVNECVQVGNIFPKHRWYLAGHVGLFM